MTLLLLQGGTVGYSQHGWTSPLGLPIAAYVPMVLALDLGIAWRTRFSVRIRFVLAIAGIIVALIALVPLRHAVNFIGANAMLQMVAGTGGAFSLGSILPLCLVPTPRRMNRIDSVWLRLAVVSVGSLTVWLIVGRRLGTIGLVPLVVGILAGLGSVGLLVFNARMANRG